MLVSCLSRWQDNQGYLFICVDLRQIKSICKKNMTGTCMQHNVDIYYGLIMEL